MEQAKAVLPRDIVKQKGYWTQTIFNFFKNLMHFFFIYPVFILFLYGILVVGEGSITNLLTYMQPKISEFLTHSSEIKAQVLSYHFSKFMIIGACLLAFNIAIKYSKADTPVLQAS